MPGGKLGDAVITSSVSMAHPAPAAAPQRKRKKEWKKGFPRFCLIIVRLPLEVGLGIRNKKTFENSFPIPPIPTCFFVPHTWAQWINDDFSSETPRRKGFMAKEWRCAQIAKISTYVCGDILSDPTSLKKWNLLLSLVSVLDHGLVQPRPDSREYVSEGYLEALLKLWGISVIIFQVSRRKDYCFQTAGGHFDRKYLLFNLQMKM